MPSPIRPFSAGEPTPQPTIAALLRRWWRTLTVRPPAAAPPVAAPLLSAHEVSVYRRKAKEVVHDAQQLVDHLEEQKRGLVAEFGAQAARAINPMIDHTNKLIADLTAPTAAAPTLLARAIQSVERYAQYGNEAALRVKIVRDTVAATQHAVHKDWEVLLQYRDTRLSEVPEAVKQSLRGVIEERLADVFEQLRLLQQPPACARGSNLRDLFLWKSSTDEARATQINRGLFAVDTIVSGHLPSAQEPTLATGFELLSGISEQLALLASLEQKALTVCQMLHVPSHSVDEASQMLRELHHDTGALATAPLVKDNTIQQALDSIQRHIDTASQLLEQRQQEVSDVPSEPEPFS